MSEDYFCDGCGKMVSNEVLSTLKLGNTHESQLKKELCTNCAYEIGVVIINALTNKKRDE